MREDQLWHNTVSLRHAANRAGVRFEEARDVAEALGFRTYGGRLERFEIRQLLTRLLVRTSDPQRRARIRETITDFKDRPADEAA